MSFFEDVSATGILTTSGVASENIVNDISLSMFCKLFAT